MALWTRHSARTSQSNDARCIHQSALGLQPFTNLSTLHLNILNQSITLLHHLIPSAPIRTTFAFLFAQPSDWHSYLPKSHYYTHVRIIPVSLHLWTIPASSRQDHSGILIDAIIVTQLDPINPHIHTSNHYSKSTSISRYQKNWQHSLSTHTRAHARTQKPQPASSLSTFWRPHYDNLMALRYDDMITRTHDSVSAFNIFSGRRLGDMVAFGRFVFGKQGVLNRRDFMMGKQLAHSTYTAHHQVLAPNFG